MNSYIILLILIITIYFGLYYFSKFLTIKEYGVNINTKRISQTKIYKTITRRSEEIEYEFPMDPNLDKFNIRLLSKIIDYGLYFLLFYLIKDNFQNPNFIPAIVAFFSLFIINPILETLTGRTTGKFILGLQVIDDFGRKPSLLISYTKNLLQLGVIFVYILSDGFFGEEELFFHNKKTLTYTIRSKDKIDILQKIKK